MSPGAEALAFAARWLALLSCALAQRPLPTHALELMSDLVQLLYYHGPPPPDAPRGTNDRGRSGSPLVQVSYIASWSCKLQTLGCFFLGTGLL